ncbi:hypothetical protein FDF74_12485 [Clostridium niameyense]|uniref:PAS domain-containing protein n=1 Tax=Clostridium niameyense TaxID=1622073 RepID=A0A6M0RDT3_9CLOT|nr:PAS domain-containing protein [Clostridium niameyense]NEZ47997.1 hypothetical protein [Clostridium niameyense]
MKRENIHIRDKYFFIFDSIPEPIFLLDKDNKIQNINESTKKLLKSSNEINKIIDKDNKLLWIKEELNFFKDGEYTEISFIRKFLSINDELYFKIKLKKINIEKTIYTILMLSDITYSRKLEIELKKNKNLFKEITENIKMLNVTVNKSIEDIQFLSNNINSNNLENKKLIEEKFIKVCEAFILNMKSNIKNFNFSCLELEVDSFKEFIKYNTQFNNIYLISNIIKYKIVNQDINGIIDNFNKLQDEISKIKSQL